MAHSDMLQALNVTVRWPARILPLSLATGGVETGRCQTSATKARATQEMTCQIHRIDAAWLLSARRLFKR